MKNGLVATLVVLFVTGVFLVIGALASVSVFSLTDKEPVVPEHVIFVPCAIPVFARQARTIEEYEAEAALRRDLQEWCAQQMIELRGER